MSIKRYIEKTNIGGNCIYMFSILPKTSMTIFAIHEYVFSVPSIILLPKLYFKYSPIAYLKKKHDLLSRLI